MIIMNDGSINLFITYNHSMEDNIVHNYPTMKDAKLYEDRRNKEDFEQYKKNFIIDGKL